MLYAQIIVHPGHHSATGFFLIQPDVQKMSLFYWDWVLQKHRICQLETYRSSKAVHNVSVKCK